MTTFDYYTDSPSLGTLHEHRMQQRMREVDGLGLWDLYLYSMPADQYRYRRDWEPPANPVCECGCGGTVRVFNGVPSRWRPGHHLRAR